MLTVTLSVQTGWSMSGPTFRPPYSAPSAGLGTRRVSKVGQHRRFRPVLVHSLTRLSLPAEGPVIALWPGSCLHAIETLRHPRWEDYDYTAAGTQKNRFGWVGNGWSPTEAAGGDTVRGTSRVVASELGLIWTSLPGLLSGRDRLPARSGVVVAVGSRGDVFAVAVPSSVFWDRYTLGQRASSIWTLLVVPQCGSVLHRRVRTSALPAEARKGSGPARR